MVKPMRKDTKTFKIVNFIGRSNGVRNVDVEHYICEHLMHRLWDPKKRAGVWSVSLYGYGANKGIYPRYTKKVGVKRWLNAAGVKEVLNYHVSLKNTVRIYTGPDDWIDIKNGVVQAKIDTGFPSDRIEASNSELRMEPLNGRNRGWSDKGFEAHPPAGVWPFVGKGNSDQTTMLDKIRERSATAAKKEQDEYDVSKMSDEEQMKQEAVNALNSMFEIQQKLIAAEDRLKEANREFEAARDEFDKLNLDHQKAKSDLRQVLGL